MRRKKVKKEKHLLTEFRLIALFANGIYVWIFAENSIIYKISFESNLYFIHICSSPAPEPMLAFAITWQHPLYFPLKPLEICFFHIHEFNGLILLMFHISNFINLFQILKI